MRTKTWEEATVRDVTFGDTRALVIEPGDATRYCVLLTRIAAEAMDVVDASIRGAWLVNCANIGRGVMRVHDGFVVCYRDVEREVGGMAAGSAQMLCEIAEHFTNGAVKCEPWDVFEMRLARDEARREQNRERRQAERARDLCNGPRYEEDDYDGK
jgi:hypothetical protein